jgi:hypothetical protein
LFDERELGCGVERASFTSDRLAREAFVDGGMQRSKCRAVLPTDKRDEVREVVGRLDPCNRPSAPDRRGWELLRFCQ